VFLMVKTLSGLFAVENTSVVDMRILQIIMISFSKGPTKFVSKHFRRQANLRLTFEEILIRCQKSYMSRILV
jgi:hypothetical protein